MKFKVSASRLVLNWVLIVCPIRVYIFWYFLIFLDMGPHYTGELPCAGNIPMPHGNVVFSKPRQKLQGSTKAFGPTSSTTRPISSVVRWCCTMHSSLILILLKWWPPYLGATWLVRMLWSSTGPEVTPIQLLEAHYCFTLVKHLQLKVSSICS